MQFLDQTSYIRKEGLVFPGWDSIVAYYSIKFYTDQLANIAIVIYLSYRHEPFERLQDEEP